MQICRWCAAAMAALAVVCSGTARAQLYEDVGTRAQGMGGAFVAVADDATASWWNPAGLATGALFNIVVEKDRATWPENPSGFESARRASVSGFSAAFPSLGLSYYRIRATQYGESDTKGQAAADRQDLVSAGRVRSLAVSQFGATVGQSVGNHFVIASTIKVMRGGVASATVGPSDDALDLGDDLEMSQNTRSSLDIGAMAAFRHLRVGLSVRNATEPKFGSGEDEIRLRRAARAGVLYLVNPDNPLAAITVSADADLTKTVTAVGEIRHAALGAEAWFLNRRLGVRGGLTANTIGERRPTSSTGASVAVLKSLYLEGARTFGSDGSIAGWSTTVRVTF